MLTRALLLIVHIVNNNKNGHSILPRPQALSFFKYVVFRNTKEEESLDALITLYADTDDTYTTVEDPEILEGGFRRDI